MIQIRAGSTKPSPGSGWLLDMVERAMLKESSMLDRGALR